MTSDLQYQVIQQATKWDGSFGVVYRTFKDRIQAENQYHGYLKGAYLPTQAETFECISVVMLTNDGNFVKSERVDYERPATDATEAS